MFVLLLLIYLRVSPGPVSKCLNLIEEVLLLTHWVSYLSFVLKTRQCSVSCTVLHNPTRWQWVTHKFLSFEYLDKGKLHRWAVLCCCLTACLAMSRDDSSIHILCELQSSLAWTIVGLFWELLPHLKRGRCNLCGHLITQRERYAPEIWIVSNLPSNSHSFGISHHLPCSIARRGNRSDAEYN